MNAIAGAFPVDDGQIIIDGRDVTACSEHRRARYIGRVFQDPLQGTAGGMMVEENLILAAKRGLPLSLRWAFSNDKRAHYRELLATLGLGLEDRLFTRMELLSGGQRQAVTLLMATLQRPKLLLLDEPTAALDPKTAAEVLALTDRIVREHQLTTLMITHNMRDALRLGNRLIMMHQGRIIWDVKGAEKESLTVTDVLQKFEETAASFSDSMVLA